MSNTKLFGAYGFPFSKSRDIPLELWDLARKHDSLNGFYIALPDTTTFSNIGLNANNRVSSWYDLSGSGNYLYQTNYSSSPILTTSGNLFNGKPYVDFTDTGNLFLNFKYHCDVGTIIMVYNTTSVSTSHPIYAPRIVPNSQPPVYYDLFPRSSTDLWSQDSLSSNFAYNSTSRVNGKEVLPTYDILASEPRILSIHNLGGVGETTYISGIGGRSRPQGSRISSVQGSIAAILTFKDNLSSADILELELALQELYINYNGPGLASIPSLKYLKDSAVNYDFASIAVDEWFDITQYEVIAPLDLGIDFGLLNGSVLSGTLERLYEGNLTIRITNEVGMYNDFDIPFRSLYKDVLIDSLPSLGEVSGVFSAYADSGLYLDKWEDARRLNTISLNAQTGNLYSIATRSLINNNLALITTPTTNLSGSSITGKTFVWVYVQTEYGLRSLFDTFPDIYGQGALWTVNNINTVFGATNVTALAASVNEHPVDVLSYRVPLNQVLIITAYSDNNISYSGFNNLRGYMPFFASWATMLTVPQLNQVIAVLAQRFIDDTSPLIVNNVLNYNYTTNASISLVGVAVDLHTTNPISYVLVSGSTTATIVNNTLSFTASTDSLETFEIQAINNLNEITLFNFRVQNILRINPLYIDIKRYLTGLTYDISQIYLATSDTITSTVWSEYSLQGDSIALQNVVSQSLIDYNNINALYFNTDGLSTAELNNPTIATNNLFIVYVSDVTGNNQINLFKDTLDTLYGSNTSSLFAHVTANTHYIKVNGADTTLNYKHDPYTLRVISVKLQQPKAIEYIGDILNSVKGYVLGCLLVDDVLSIDQTKYIHDLLVNYYVYAGPSLKLNFNNTIDDLVYSAATSGTAIFHATEKRFGSHSLILTSSNLFIENNTHFAFTTFNFTIGFWLKVSRAVAGADRLNIISLSGLNIYLDSRGLVVAESLTANAFLVGAIPTYLSFVYYTLVRNGDTLTLYINGANPTTVAYTGDLNETQNALQIGQTAPLTQSSNIAVYLDDLAIYSRQALYTSTFTIPTAELT